MTKYPTLFIAAAALFLASCSGPTIAETPQDAMDRRAASMGYGRNADDIKPSRELEALSEENLKEYDGNISAALLQDYLNSAGSKKQR